ncbi:MAG: lipopolysaccharide kinase InaA family protein [Phycisphaerae bacterium]
MAIRLSILEPALKDRLTAMGLKSYEDFIGSDNGAPMSGEVGSRTRRIPLDDNNPDAWGYLKIYRYARPRRLPHRLGQFPGRRDKCEIEARNYAILRQRCGVHVPDVLAFGRRSRLGRRVDSFILTRAVPNAVPLDAFAIRTTRDSCRHYLIHESAQIVARMHRAGFFHIDLQWRNILVSDDGSDRPPLFLIDSARGTLRRGRVFREHGRLRDLSSLHKEARQGLSPREEIRWLRRYLGIHRLRPGDRALIHAIRHDRSIKDGDTT